MSLSFGERDVVLIGPSDTGDFNPDNILPEPANVRASIIRRLSPTEYDNESSEYQKHLSLHLSDSCDWVFSTAAYQQWHASPSLVVAGAETDADVQQVPGNILWVRGVPGSGKSVLASTLIKKLHQEGCPVLYFYFRHTITANHSPVAALRDWLAQVLQYSPPLQAELKRYVEKDSSHSQSDVFSSLTYLFGFLRTALSHLPMAYILVDALDEMDQDLLESFVHHFDELAQWRPSRVKLIMTSRPIAVIEKMLRKVNVLDIPLDKRVESDIAAYIQHRLATSSIPVEDHPRVTETVLRRCDGLFLYARLAMDRVLAEPELDDDALATIPAGLSVMYANILEEQSRRSDIPPGIQQLVLKCVTHATRPLRLLEISDLINTRQDAPGEDLGTTKNLVRSICGPLLQILPDETVHVVHHSLTEFLNGTTKRSEADSREYAFVHLPGPTHNHMALLCISHLRANSLDCIRFDTNWEQGRYITMASKQAAPPFTLYAVLNWHIHARKAMMAGHDQSEVNDLVLELFNVEGNLEKLGFLDGARNATSFTPLSVATSLGLTSLAREVLERAELENTQLFKDGPLIHTAGKHDDADLIKLLLEYGADPRAYDDHGNSPLHRAVWSGRHQVVQVLLDAGVDAFMAKGSDSPAHYVFRLGDAKMVSLFLPCLKTVKQVNWALSEAISHKRHDIIERLLKHPLIDLNFRASLYGTPPTPLYQACSLRDATAIELLLKAGADPNFIHRQINGFNRAGRGLHEGCNVLHALSGSGYPFVLPYQWTVQGSGDDEITRRCFKLVLDAGADLGQADEHGRTPLHVATDVSAVKCLLDAGIDPNVTDRRGETPLHSSRSEDIIRALLPRVNVNSKASHRGATPLLSVLMNVAVSATERIAKASQFLDFGADAAAVDDRGNGTLHYAASSLRELGSDCFSLLERLRAGGADVNLRNGKGRTPMHYCLPGVSNLCIKGAWVAVGMLITAGADLEARDNKGQTPLFQLISYSAYCDVNEIIKIAEQLMAAGARIDTTDLEGRNLLHCAASNQRPDTKLTRFLLANGIDPQQTDGKGNTIWHLCAPALAGRVPKPNEINELVSLGVDPNMPNNNGQSPLHLVVGFHPPFESRTSFLDLDWGSRRVNADDGCFFDHFVALCRGCGNTNFSIDCVDLNRVTPLHIASTFSEYLTRRLLEEGADLTRPTAEGLTVLHLAARSNQTNTMGLLLARLRSRVQRPGTLLEVLNARDRLNRSALYYACASGRPETVQILLDAGAATDTESYTGSPWEGCVALQYDEEKANWRWAGESDQDAAGVLISDTLRTKVYEYPKIWRPETTSRGERLDEIIDLLVLHSGGGVQYIEEAIAVSVEGKFDHATECLLRARESLGIKEQYLLDEETSARLLSRRNEMPPPRENRSPVEILMADRRYSLAASEMLRNPSGTMLCRLVVGGFSKLFNELINREYFAKAAQHQEQDSGQQPLLVTACEQPQWNMNIVRLLVEKMGSELNATAQFASGPYKRGQSAVHALVRGGRWWQVQEALPYLLSRGADTEVRDGEGMTPLAAALESIKATDFSRKAVETLLQFGADPNAMDDRGRGCLSMTGGNMDVYQLLICHGATVTPSTIVDMINRKDVALLEATLAGGVDPNLRQIPKRASRGRSDTSQIDISSETPDPSHSDKLDYYPLELVASNLIKHGSGDEGAAWEKMLQLLLEHGANPSARYEKTTVLHRIIEGDFSDRDVGGQHLAVRLLLQSPKLELEERDDKGMTVLHVAASKAARIIQGGDEQTLVQMLLNAGFCIYAEDTARRTVLHHLLTANRFAYIYIDGFQISVKKPDIGHVINAAPELLHSVDSRGRTPLHATLDSDMTNALDLKELVEAGSDVTVPVGSTGDTVLHLLFRQAWTIEVDDEVWVGETPQNIYADRRARSVQCVDGDGHPHKDKGILRFLLSKGGFYGDGHLHKDEGILRFLFAKGGLDVNARNKEGKTPVFGIFEKAEISAVVVHGNRSHGVECQRRLEAAASLEREPLVWQLMDDLGVDWTATSNDGETLLHVVAASGKTEWQSEKRSLERFKFLIGKGLDAMEENAHHRTPLDVAAAAGHDEILALFK